jgi:hypothetical protein
MNIRACDFGQMVVYQKDIAGSINVAIVFAVINNFTITRCAIRWWASNIA